MYSQDQKYNTSLATFYIYGWLTTYTTHEIIHKEVDVYGTEFDLDLEEADLNLVSITFHADYAAYNKIKGKLSNRTMIGGPYMPYVKDSNKVFGFAEPWLEKEFGVFNTTRQLILPPDAAPGFILNYPNGYGCSWGKCNFCDYKINNPYLKYKVTSMEVIERELTQLFDNDFKDRIFSHVFMTADYTPPKRIIQLDELLCKFDKINSWSCFLRGDSSWDTINDFNVIKFIGGFIGIEIFDDIGLKILNKNIEVSNLKKCCSILSKESKHATTGAMTHLPFEDYDLAKKILQNSLNNYKRYKNVLKVGLCNRFILYPNTAWFDKYAKPKGITKPCYAKYSPKFQDLWDNYRKEIKQIFPANFSNDPDFDELLLF